MKEVPSSHLSPPVRATDADRRKRRQTIEDNILPQVKKPRSNYSPALVKDPEPPQENYPITNEQGYYIVRPGARLTDRYDVIKKLGEGTFGTVVEAYDRKRKYNVAIKVTRNIDRYREAALIEKRILRHLYTNSSHKYHTITMLGYFAFHDHVCLSFERAGPTLHHVLHLNRAGFDLETLRTIAYQIFRCIAFIHDLGLIHTDLKTENIIFSNKNYTYSPNAGNAFIKVIDFGSAMFERERLPKLACTRQYRPPEILLGIPWGKAADIWSIGCILYEMATGELLFSTHCNWEHLQMIHRLFGPCPVNMVRRAKAHSTPSSVYFNTNLELRSLTVKSQRERVKMCGSPRTTELLATEEHIAESLEVLKNFKRFDKIKDPLLLDVIRKCLKWDPNDRISAADLVQHPFILRPKSSSSQSSDSE
ncbi:hypothetical protein RCL1_006706 [Eukaryota sp. TZLM3-RCL]